MAFALGALVGGGFLGGCGENEIPENPTWSANIEPLMTAKCIRCHGAGGNENTDPEMPPIYLAGATQGSTTPIGDFTTMMGAELNCEQQPKGVLEVINEFVVGIGMPPPPAERLDDWSVQLLRQWCLSGMNP